MYTENVTFPISIPHVCAVPPTAPSSVPFDMLTRYIDALCLCVLWCLAIPFPFVRGYNPVATVFISKLVFFFFLFLESYRKT